MKKSQEEKENKNQEPCACNLFASLHSLYPHYASFRSLTFRRSSILKVLQDSSFHSAPFVRRSFVPLTSFRHRAQEELLQSIPLMQSHSFRHWVFACKHCKVCKHCKHPQCLHSRNAYSFHCFQSPHLPSSTHYFVLILSLKIHFLR